MSLPSRIRGRELRVRVTPLTRSALLRAWLHLNEHTPPGYLLLPRVPLGDFLEVEGMEIPELDRPVALVLLNLEGWPLLVVLEREDREVEALLNEARLEWTLLEEAEAALKRLFAAAPSVETAPAEPVPEPVQAESPPGSAREAAREAFAREFWSGKGSWGELYRRYLQSIRVQAEREDAPLCPICKGPMQLKTARQGRGAGKQFWSCARFPSCKGTRPFKDPAP